MDSFERVRAAIERKFVKQSDPRPVTERLLDYAYRGMEAPESMSLEEIQQVSFALFALLTDYSRQRL